MKRNFLTGLVIVLPIALTFIILMLIIDLLTNPFMGFVERCLHQTPITTSPYPILSSAQAIRIWSQIFILLALFFGILILGFFARLFLFRLLVKWGDRLIHRIPIINKLYKTVKEVIEVIFTSKERAFKQVVMVSFPNSSTFCIGFLSKHAPKELNEPTKNDLMSVFLPTTPNPTTGYLLQFPTKDIIHLDMSVEEALKFIVSCGIVSNKELNEDKQKQGKLT